MTPFSDLPPTDATLERLLSETFLRFRQGRLAEATERLAKAKETAPDHPRVIELEGDIAFTQNRFVLAEKCYKRAHELDPNNTKLEEKYATAVLRVHLPGYRLPDDSPWSNRTHRPPALSALQSAFVPGLGQLYNGDWLKGLLIFLVSLMGNLAQLRHIGNDLYAAKGSLTSLSMTMILREMWSGPQVILTLILLAIWCYSVIDAWMVAKNTT